MLNLKYSNNVDACDGSVELRMIKLPAGFGCNEFYISETPITEAQWCAIIGGTPRNPNYPMVNVSYNDAQLFCNKASSITGALLRLPTEREWCRAIGIDPSPEDLDKYAVFGKENLCAVKTKLPNEYGIYDMRGLVCEWMLSLDAVATTRVLRGASWRAYDYNCRSASRLRVSPGSRYVDFGFRVVAQQGGKIPLCITSSDQS